MTSLIEGWGALMRIAVVATSLCLSVVGLASATDAQAMVREATSIPPQPLDNALRALAKERGFHIVYLPAVVNSLLTQGATGTFTRDEALTHLLSGTGLAFHYLNDDTVTVVPMLGTGGRDGDSVGDGAAKGVRTKSFWDRFRVAQVDQGRTFSEEGELKREAVAGDSSGSSTTQTIDEVIVTAQKREERLQDVPISISVLSGELIEKRGFVSQADYLRGMPGVSQSDGPFGSSFNIRGIATDPKGRGAGSYFGETDTTTASSGVAGLDIKLVDIERVEVLRGPQGTAFGAASIGGLIRTIPNTPRLDATEGKVSASYSATSDYGSDNNMAQGVVNVPLISERLAIRASAYRFDDSGFIRNVAGSSAVLQTYSAQFGAEAAATGNDKDVGAEQYTGGRVAALWQIVDNAKLTLTYLKQKTEHDGLARGGAVAVDLENEAGLGDYDQLLWEVAPEHVVRGEVSGVRDSDLDLFNATLDYDLGWGSLIATGSYIESLGRTAFSFPLAVPFSQGADSNNRVKNGEVRLASSFSGPVNFLAGLYAEDIKEHGFFDYYWLGSQPNAFGQPTRFLGHSLEDQETQQQAAFGEVSWKFLPAFTLTAGGRYYDYDRETLSDTSGLFGVQTTPLSGGDSGSNYKANLSYQPDRNVHLYATWAQGFGLGSPSAGLPEDACDTDGDGIVDGSNGLTIESTRFVKSNNLDSYELGAKLNLANGRIGIDAAVYRIDWKDMPFTVRAPGGVNSGCTFNYETNLGTATSQGFELQLNMQLTDKLFADLGGSLTKAKLTTDVPAQGLSSDDRLPGSPEVNASAGLQYNFGMFGRESSVRADGIYVGKFYGDFGESPVLEVGDYVKIDLALSAQITQALEAKLFAHNLTNEDAFMYKELLGITPLYGYRLRPRTIALQLTYDF